MVKLLEDRGDFVRYFVPISYISFFFFTIVTEHNFIKSFFGKIKMYSGFLKSLLLVGK